MPYDPKKAVSFAQSKSGRYSDGECWTLAKDAIVDAGGAKPASIYVWGAVVQVAQLKVGDVLQFSSYAWLQQVTTEVVFSHPEGENQNEKVVSTTVDMMRGEPQHTAIVTNILSPGLVEVVEQNIPRVTGEVQIATLALIPRQFPTTTEVVRYQANINGKDVDATQTIKKSTKETVAHPPICYRPT
jgi:hypothetical protein